MHIWAKFSCSYYLAIVWHSPDKTNQSHAEKAIQIFPTGFDTSLLIGQYFSSLYFRAIAMASLLIMVMSIAELQLFG